MQNIMATLRSTGVTVICALMLTACNSSGTNLLGTTNGATTGANTGVTINNATNMGRSLLASAIDNRCRSELEQQNMWRVARAVMSVEQEQAAQDKICSCVSEQAPQQVTIVQMTNAAVDATYRAQLVTEVVAKSLQSCYSSVVR